MLSIKLAITEFPAEYGNLCMYMVKIVLQRANTGAKKSLDTFLTLKEVKIHGSIYGIRNLRK